LTCKGIELNPEVGEEYVRISDNLLGLKSRKHIIFYKASSDERIEVVRILHERMELKKGIIE
jgi:toxin ParE1/3/4